MKLHHLKVTNLAGIGTAEISFGPGLNVLYGPNDLGKSTLADAIRLALLLPHASTHCDDYIPWAGGADPVVDLTFDTDEQRFWRVRKEFGRGGSSVLQESRNGRDFDDVERARKVDAKLREILCWGIPEPGGAGSAKGLPSSFLATALLSTQADVTAVLGSSLQADPTSSGKDRIAAALQAVAQDPMFVTLLREGQRRWDEAYTDKGKKSTARTSVFKAAADRLREVREEKDRLQRIVEDSEGVEHSLQALLVQRISRANAYAGAERAFGEVEELASQAAAHAIAANELRAATEVKRRIESLAADVATAERKLLELAGNKVVTLQRLEEARRGVDQASEALKQAEDRARSAEADAEMADTVARQQLELRKAAAETAAAAAQQTIAASAAAQQLVDDASAAERELAQQVLAAAGTREQSTVLDTTLEAARDRLSRCDLLEQALALRTAEALVASRQADVTTKTALDQRLEQLSIEQAALTANRTAISVPEPAALGRMRTLASDRAGARGVLDVGLIVTVTPAHPPLQLRVASDGAIQRDEVIVTPVEIEAGAELDVVIADLATVQVRGGRRDARERLRAFDDRWNREVVPYLTAAGVADLEALQAKVEEARNLDAAVASLQRDTADLKDRIAALGGAAAELQEASNRAAQARESLGDVAPENLANDLAALGSDAVAVLRTRRQRSQADMDAARTAMAAASTALAVADERVRTLRQRSDVAVAARDAAGASFPLGAAVAAENAQAALRATRAEIQTVARDLGGLQGAREARAQRLNEAIAGVSEAAERALAAVDAAEKQHQNAVSGHDLAVGGLAELRKRLAAEDLNGAQAAVDAASDALAALPVPQRPLRPGEVEEARALLGRLKRELEETEREVQRTQGALEQVGGAVARERLREAVEAFERAESNEREVEADYEAWKLLVEQMKEADAAQASNLGQVLAPVIAGQFAILTGQRYQGVQLTAQLETAGVVLGGAVRSSDRLSVGTREQLSTIYRLCLGEYLRTTIVLDDQLVQSDGTRMDWFREMLIQKARLFQIIVFTCRPDDYLAGAARPSGEAIHADTEDGFIRAIDLHRAVRRR